MNALKWIAVLAVGGLVSACSVAPSDVASPDADRVTAKQSASNVAPQQQGQIAAAPAAVVAPKYRINAIAVDVPAELEVSESNSYYPGADIVWREDPIGDRHAQVRSIVEAAMRRGAQDIRGDTPVNLEVEVERFHALTERARYTIGGVHAITFTMQLSDPASGQLVQEPKRVFADLEAFGGLQAIRAENQGITQKVRITGHLAEVLKREMNLPEGHENASLGLIQVLNKF